MLDFDFGISSPSTIATEMANSEAENVGCRTASANERFGSGNSVTWIPPDLTTAFALNPATQGENRLVNLTEAR